ncbi:MAG: TonB-dependent receptor [Acidobacteria bacterium]|nr:TonB-dependent receptor [Acidobacteriota bacterium]
MQRWFFCVLIAVLIAPSAWPQTSTGSVNGTIRDESAAVIPSAAVTLTNKATNVSSKTTSSEVGFYMFPGIVPGDYLISVEAPGMQKYEASLVVQVQQRAVVNVTMKVGQTATTVAVLDVTPMVQTESPTLSHTLERVRIEQLPINGRALTSLLQTVPGQEGTRAFGLRDFSFEMVLDGAALADRYSWNTVTARQPGLDSIQEFRVENNASSAKFSRPTSIIVTTKGGTNAIHGTVFETNRNSGYGVARARQDSFTKAPFLNRNEFGATAGGPVYIPKLYNGKNKTFWFTSWEGYRQISSTTLQRRLPTQEMRNGNMAGFQNAAGNAITIYDPWTTDSNSWSRLPYANNQLPASRQSPLSKYLFPVTQLPTLPNVNPMAAPNYIGTYSPFNFQWTTANRIDHRFSEKDSFYGRYSQGSFRNRSQFYGVPSMDWNKVPGNTQGTISPNWSMALSHVHTFSPTFFNELLVTGTRTRMDYLTGDGKTCYNCAMGTPNPFNVNQWPGLYNLGFGGDYQFETQNGNGFYAFYNIVDDNATKIKGKHELQFGFHFRSDQMNLLPQQQQGGGNFNFDSNSTALYDPSTSRTNPAATPFTGDQFANFYLGLGRYSNQLNRGMFYARSKEWSGYFQDNWRATPRLTLNLGLRYDLFPPYYEKNNAVSAFDPSDHSVVLGTSMDNLIKLGYTFPAIVNRLTDMGMKFKTYDQAGLPQHMINTSKDGWGPRAGFAYRIGDGAKSFVVRGGYRISYFHFVMGGWAARMRMNAPMTARFYFDPVQAAYSPDGVGNYLLRTVPTIIAGQNSANVVQPSDAKSLARGCCGVSYFNKDMPDPRVQDWNLTFEKEIMANTIARAGYFGNHSTRLEQLYQFNNTTPDYVWFTTTKNPLPTGEFSQVATRFFNKTSYGTIERWQNTGWGNSNGIQLELERRYSKGFAYQLFYVMDNNIMAGGGGYSGTSPIPEVNQFLPGAVPADLNARNNLLNKQRDIGIPKHRVRWNFLVDLPFGKGKPILGNAGSWLNRLVGGYQIAGMGSLASTYLTLPSGLFPTGNKLETYGYKYPIEDCTSGNCYPGYLWYNGYIPAYRINSTDPRTGKPNGYMGIPADYKPAVAPLWPYPADYNPSAPCAGRTGLDATVCSYYGGNTLWIPLNNGAIQRTSWGGLPPLRNQYIPSVRQWGLDASIFKTIPITEGFTARVNADFFNVLNHPGNPNSVGTTGMLATRNSGTGARVLQLSLRLTW